MGSDQSRIGDDDAPANGTDDWMSRVEVKASQELVTRLEQQQVTKDEPPAVEPIESNREGVSSSSEATQREEKDNERRVKEEEDNARIRQLLMAKDAEAAHISGLIDSVVTPSDPSGQYRSACSKESRVVVTCLGKHKDDGGGHVCSELVDALEACTARATCYGQ